MVEDPPDEDWWVNLTGTILSFPPYNLSICFWTKLPPDELVIPVEEQVEADPESSDPGDPSRRMEIGIVPAFPENYKSFFNLAIFQRMKQVESISNYHYIKI